MRSARDLPRNAVQSACLSLIAVISTCLIVRTAIYGYLWSRPIPYWDQWEFTKSLPALMTGKFTFHDLIAQHNEHRIATSRVFFILDALLFDSSSYSCIVVLYLTLALIAILLASCIGRRNWRPAVFVPLILGILLSPSQWENLSSGFQIQFPFVDLFILASCGCLIQALRRSRSTRDAVAFLLAASACDLLAVFSMASGVLLVGSAIWIAAVLRYRLRFVLVFVTMHALYTILFFSGYVKSADIASTYDVRTILQFAIVYMGACLRGYAHAPFILGSVDAGLSALAVGLVLRRSLGDRRTLDDVQVFATSIILLLFAGACLTAYGRASLGIASAVSSRYSLQSLLCQAVLLVFYWREIERGGRWVRRRSVAMAGLLAAALSLSVLSNLSPLSIEEWQDRASTLDGAGFAIANGVFDDGMLKGVYPQPGLIRAPLQFLAANRLGPFSASVGNVFRAPLNVLAGSDLSALPLCTAAFDAKRLGPTWLELEGWSFDPAEPSGDGWVLVIDEAEQGRIVGFGRQSVERHDVDEALAVSVGRSGFDVALNSPAFVSEAPRPLTLVLFPNRSFQPACKASTVYGGEP